MNIIRTILQVIAIVIVIDIIGFMMWYSSGQRPADDFYIGSLTTHTINLFK